MPVAQKVVPGVDAGAAVQPATQPFKCVLRCLAVARTWPPAILPPGLGSDIQAPRSHPFALCLVNGVLGRVTDACVPVCVSGTEREEQSSVVCGFVWNLVRAGHFCAVVRYYQGGRIPRKGKRKLVIPGVAGQEPLPRVAVVGFVDTKRQTGTVPVGAVASTEIQGLSVAIGKDDRAQAGWPDVQGAA